MAGEPNPSEFVFENGTPIGWYEPLPRDWPQIYYDSQNTGYNPNAKPATDGNQEWKVSIEDVNNYQAPVTSADDYVYIGEYWGLYEFLASDGTKNKTFDDAWMEVAYTAAIDGDYVYVGDAYNGSLRAFNRRDKTEVWSKSMPNYQPTAPTISNGYVYVNDVGANLYKLDADDGSESWSFSNSGNVQGTPAVANGFVYNVSDNILRAHDDADGSVLWSRSDSSYATEQCPVVGSDGTVYCGTYNDEMIAHDSNDGSTIWAFGASDQFRTSPAFKDGVLFASSQDNFIYALDTSDGSEIWSFDTGGGHYIAGPIVAGDIVYDGNTNYGSENFYALDTNDGSVIWSLTGDYTWNAPPAIANGNIFLAPGDKYLYSYT